MRSIYSEEYQAAISRLVEARKAAELTQGQVATAWGRDQSIIAKIESCVRRLDIAEFVALAIIVNADPHAIIQDLRTRLSTIYPESDTC